MLAGSALFGSCNMQAGPARPDRAAAIHQGWRTNIEQIGRAGDPSAMRRPPFAHVACADPRMRCDPSAGCRPGTAGRRQRREAWRDPFADSGRQRYRWSSLPGRRDPPQARTRSPPGGPPGVEETDALPSSPTSAVVTPTGTRRTLRCMPCVAAARAGGRGPRAKGRSRAEGRRDGRRVGLQPRAGKARDFSSSTPRTRRR